MNASVAASQRRRYLANSSDLSSVDGNMSTRERTRQAQTARREIAAKVREDWSFLWPAESNVSVSPPSDESLEYVARNFSASSSPAPSAPSSPGHEVSEDDTTYRFDSPDAVGSIIAARARSSRKRRRLAQEAELEWNAGLQHWTAQRNAWSGGMVRDVASSLQGPPPTIYPGKLIVTNPSTSDTDERTPATEPVELIPLYPPLLPRTHPVRAPITPAAYPALYSKIVVKSMTPTVPINLADMTSAIVQGWKADDQWPPKATPLEPSFARSRKKILREEAPLMESESGRRRSVARGVGAVKKVLGLSNSGKEGP